MADVTQLTRSTYAAFVAAHRVAAVLFDAPAWNMTYRLGTAERFAAAAAALGDRAALGFVDVDGPDEVEMCKALPVLNVPLIAYYREGLLVAALIGIGQDVAARVTAVIEGRPIGYKDGRGGST
jgi:hypothetical protein